MTSIERRGTIFAAQAIVWWFLFFLTIPFPVLAIITIPWAFSLRRQWRGLQSERRFNAALRAILREQG